MVDERVRGVHILLTDAFGSSIEHTTTKGNDLAIDRHPREHGSSTETVIYGAIVALDAEPCINEVFLVISFGFCLVRHGCWRIKTETKTELSDDVITETSATEIGKSDGTSVLIVHHGLAKILGSPFIDSKHAFTLVHSLPLFVGHFLFFHRNAVFLRQML